MKSTGGIAFAASGLARNPRPPRSRSMNHPCAVYTVRRRKVVKYSAYLQIGKEIFPKQENEIDNERTAVVSNNVYNTKVTTVDDLETRID